MNLPAPQFQTIPEQDAFLALFPHRYDYIWADHPDPGDRPEWKTESRHPLSDRQILQGTYLYGVRFGKQTHYLMLDIDPGSPYHPTQDPFAIHRLVAALEPLGLVETVAVSSSYRNGIHLYLPFPTPQESWAIAQAASTLLTNAGFKLKPGQLELFPNPRTYSEAPGLYAAHRLPLQTGSYLLNHDFHPIFGNQTSFIQRWSFAQQRNEIDRPTLERILKQARRRRYKLSGKAEKFLNDLNTEIEAGWTDSGQTNYLLGRIAMREYIFGHVRFGSEPLTGEALATAIEQVSRSLPGFDTYCNHQPELGQRAILYARSIQASGYYPFGYKNQPKPLIEPTEPNQPNWNQQQSQAARDRIRQAVADLLNQNALPAQTTARRQAIRAYRIGNQTLDKYKQLWHPQHLKPNQERQYHPIQEPSTNSERLQPNQERQYHPIHTNKLVPYPASLLGQADGLQDVGGCGGFSTGETVPSAQPQAMRVEKHLAKMQVWLESGDPILVAESEQFFAITAQKQTVSSLETDEMSLEPVSSDLQQEDSMSGGFGTSQSKQRRGGKTSLKEVRQLSDAAKNPVQENRDVAMQAEVEAFFAQYQQEHSDEVALAWLAGMYNPLVGMEHTHARLLTPEEEDWLGLAKAVEWLLVEDELEVIYFTAPPPEFALEQADWYVRPDLTTFLDEPVLLREVVQQYPVSLKEIQGAIAQRLLQLGWTSQQQKQFMLEMFEKPQTELTEDEWEFLLFELESQLSDSD